MATLDFESVEYDTQFDGLSIRLHSQPGASGISSSSWRATCPSVASCAWGVIEDYRRVAQPDATLLANLAHHLPILNAVGIVHWGWVCSFSLPSQHLAQQVATQLPQLALTVFHDLEHAVSQLRKQTQDSAVRLPKIITSVLAKVPAAIDECTFKS